MIQTTSTNFPGNYSGYDDRLNLDEFRKVIPRLFCLLNTDLIIQNLQIQISNLDKTSTEFDLIGIDASVANAFRRILIAELPSMVEREKKTYELNNQ